MTTTELALQPLTAALLSVSPSALQFSWGTDNFVLWIEDLTTDNQTIDQIDRVLDRIGFAIELQTGYDSRTDSNTLHPLYGYRMLLRDATGLWHGIRADETGHFAAMIPLQELDYEIAYDKVMWV
jgi:hypothetical protein